MTVAERFHLKAASLIKRHGSKCTVTVAGEAKSAFGLIVIPKTTQKTDEGYVSTTQKECYLTCKITDVPTPGSVVTFPTAAYVVTDVEPIVIGDTAKGVIAYKLMVGV